VRLDQFIEEIVEGRMMQKIVHDDCRFDFETALPAMAPNGVNGRATPRARNRQKLVGWLGFDPEENKP
jgi:hypothetical protein